MDVKNNAPINLENRIDALTLALQSLESNPKQAPTVRRMVATLRAASEMHGMTELANFARSVEEASPESLAAHLTTLIGHMRSKLALQNPRQWTILLVSSDVHLQESLTTALTSSGRIVITCNTAACARQILKDNPPSFLILDIILSGEDGRQMIADLRSDPVSAAMPILAILPQHADVADARDLVHGADAYFNKPVDGVALADYMSSNLKRGFELGRESRRDRVSGLPNRAAFGEAFEALRARSLQNGEPLSLALIGLHQYDHLARECHNDALDALIRASGAILSSSFRTTDVVARWGISEFIAAFPGEDHFGATCAVEKVLTLINQQSITTAIGKSIPVHACAGSAVVNPAETFKDTVNKVEGYLFQSLFACPENDAGVSIVSDAMPGSERTARIAMCVGDARLERAVVQMILKDRIEVTAFPDQQKAIDQLTTGGFNMLIVDDALPDQSAFTLIKHIRAVKSLVRLHIVILAANEESVSKALAAGVNDYVLKPVVAEHFLSRLRHPLSCRERSPASDLFTVMVVDQTIPQLLIAGTTLFQQTGCSILLAQGFHDALSRFRDRRPDCMVLDCDIPEIALRSFAEHLGKLPEFNRIQLVAACASSQVSDAIPRQLLPFKGRVDHPFKPDTFLTQLKSIITLPSPGTSSSNRPHIDAEIQRLLARAR